MAGTCTPSFNADWEEAEELHASLFMSLPQTEADVMMLIFIASVSDE